MDGPPPIPPRPPGYELPPDQSGVTSPPALPPRRSGSDYAPPPPAPPRAPQQPSGWTHLSYDNGEPTPLFEALLNDFFTVLDPQNTGYLTPEVFSSFLAVIGFTPTEDPCPSSSILLPLSIHKTSNFHAQKTAGLNNHRPLAAPFLPIDNADFELKAVYEVWHFAHTVRPRTNLRPVIPYGGMPLLAREGFVAYMALEHAADGEPRHRGLNAALRRYGHLMGPGPSGAGWLALGPVPRWVLPAAMPAEVRRRTDEANTRSVRLAAEKIEANRVSNLLKAQGRRNAEELTGDYRYVWSP